MKKTPKKAQAKRQATAPTPIPPLAAAIVTFVDPGCNAIPTEFQRAWAAVPAIVKQLENNQDSGEPRYAYVVNQAEQAIAASRKTTGRYDRLLSQAVDVLDNADDEMRHSLYSAYSEPSFHLGLAIGLYLAMNGGAR